MASRTLPKPPTGFRPGWLSPLSIPAGRSGKLEVVHDVKPAGEPVTAGNLRTAIFRGQPNTKIQYDTETRWHKLLDEDNGTWMTDYPIEQIQHAEELKPLRGRVLVGGLGLGLTPTVLSGRRKVREVTVVERSPDVVRLVAPYLRRGKLTCKLEVVTADLFDYLKACPDGRHDSAFYDVWQSDGEGTFHGVVQPLRDLSRGKVATDPVNWNESVMRGQLRLSLYNRLMFWGREWSIVPGGKPRDVPERWQEMEAGSVTNYDARHWNWAVPFYRAVREAVGENPDSDVMAGVIGARLRELAAWYGENWGRWGWEGAWPGVKRVTLSGLAG